MKILVFDIGGTFLKYGYCTERGLFHVDEIPTEADKGGRCVIDQVISAIQKEQDYDAIGISTAGQVDVVNGRISYANQNIPGYTGMEVRRELEERFRVPVMVGNDVNAAAIGEAVYGAGKNRNSFLCMTYGTGIGGAIVENRKIYHGASFSAGEFGAIVTHGRERIEGTDYFAGCYEKYASTTALIREASKYNGQLSNGRKIFASISDEKVKEIVDRWIDEVMVGLSSVIHIFNPECVVLGGGIMTQPYIIDQIRNRIDQYIMPSFLKVDIRNAVLGNKAGLWGINHLTQEYIHNLNK